MQRSAKDGASHREHLEAAAATGNTEALEALQGPPLPEEVAYLYEWAKEMVGRSGISQAGLCPLSHAEIRAWAGLHDRQLEPFEVHALIQIDTVMRAEDKESEPEPARPRDEVWPEKKN